MSQRDVLAELRAAHVEAPPQLRARVRLIAAQAPERPRRRPRFALVLVPVAAAAAVAAGVFFSTRPSRHAAVYERATTVQQATRAAGALAAPVPAPAQKRLQRYNASLQLQVADVQRTATKAVRVATSLGGYLASVHIDTSRTHGDAELLLRVPRAHVQAAVARLARLGTVTGEQVDIQDLQAGVNTSDRTVARLQRQLEALRAQGAPKAQIAALTARVVALQRQRAATVRAAHFASVQVSLATPPAKAASHHHYAKDALPWLGGAALVLVLLLMARGLARIREDRLLSRP